MEKMNTYRRLRQAAASGDVRAIVMLLPSDELSYQRGLHRARQSGEAAAVEFKKEWAARQQRAANKQPKTPQQFAARQSRIMEEDPVGALRDDLVVHGGLDQKGREQLRRFFRDVQGWPREEK
jgi:hypothetical protein